MVNPSRPDPLGRTRAPAEGPSTAPRAAPKPAPARAPDTVRAGGLAPHATPPAPGGMPPHRLRAQAEPTVGAALRDHLDGVARHLGLLGRAHPTRHTGLTRAVMTAPALLASRHDVGAMQDRFWANRVSRDRLVGARGEIAGPAHDQTLRSEGSSFWVEATVAPADVAALAARPLADQLAAAMFQALRRLSAHAEAAHLGDAIEVLLWRGGQPFALTVPRALLEGDAASAQRALGAALRRFGLDGGPTALPASVTLTPAAALQLQARAYGPYDGHDAATRALLDADVAFVLDPQVSLDALHDPAQPWVTGGARMKEVHVFRVAEDAHGRAHLAGAATRTGHVWWDGLDAQRFLLEDLRALPAALPGRGVAPTLALAGVDASALTSSRAWAAALARTDAPAALAPEWTGARAIPADVVGWGGSGGGWAGRVTALRAAAEARGEALAFTLPDLYAKAHPLAAGAAHAHTLFAGRSLDLAYDAHPSALNAHFERFFAHCAARGITSASQLDDAAWAALAADLPEQVAAARDTLTAGFALFHEEKARAREGRSTISFFAALAEFQPRIEDLFAAISGQPALIGRTLTRAIAQPAGLCSNTAGSRGVSASDPSEPAPRTFYTAASDAYRPRDPRQLREPWAGVLGVGERPGEGHVLTLRLLPDQAWPQISAALDALELPAPAREAARRILEAEVRARAPDPLRLEQALAGVGLGAWAAPMMEAIDRALSARVDAQLERTELAVELTLRCLETR